MGGGPGGASGDARLGPDLAPVPSPDLWLKVYRARFAARPAWPSAAAAAGGWQVIAVSVGMFLAWGPPDFPVRAGSEAVTAEELAARVEDWWRTEAEPGAAADGGA